MRITFLFKPLLFQMSADESREETLRPPTLIHSGGPQPGIVTTPGGLTIVPGGAPRLAYPGGSQGPPRLPNDPRLRAPLSPGQLMRPPTSVPGHPAPRLPQVPTGPRADAPPAGVEAPPKITVKELMINVIEKSLAPGPDGPGGPSGGASGSQAGMPPVTRASPHGSPASSVAGMGAHNSNPPTIHNILENSTTPKNYVRDARQQGGAIAGRPPHQVLINAGALAAVQEQREVVARGQVQPRLGPMAPPTTLRGQAPPPPPSAQGGSGGGGGDDGTLDLSMPSRRRESPGPAGPPPPSQGGYREPPGVVPGGIPGRQPRASPVGQAPVPGSATANSAAPPPAHSSNKVSTNPDLVYSRNDPRQAPSPSYGRGGPSPLGSAPPPARSAPGGSRIYAPSSAAGSAASATIQAPRQPLPPPGLGHPAGKIQKAN